MLHCKTISKNVGTVREGETVDIQYVIENVGTQNITMNPWASCGCSTPILPKDTIAPKEKVILTVKFDTMGKVGINEKRVGIKYKTNKDQNLTLKFIAEVVK